jgi:hypothetical protein
MAKDEFPAWHFSSMDWDGPFGWHSIDRNEMEKLIERLACFESNTWLELMHQGRRNHHYMDVSVIDKSASRRLQEIRQDDIDEVFSFRIRGPIRLWGIVDRHIFKILWWDPDHKVYPMDLADN